MPQRLTWAEEGYRLRVILVRMIEADITNIPELRNTPTTSFLVIELSDQELKITVILTFSEVNSVGIVGE
jgi:hypothetical protein